MKASKTTFEGTPCVPFTMNTSHMTISIMRKATVTNIEGRIEHGIIK